MICVLYFLQFSIYILRYRIPRLFYLRTEKKKKKAKPVLNVVGIILSQLYNEVVSPGNRLSWERNSKYKDLLLSLILISITWYLTFTNTFPGFYTSTELSFEPYIFSSSSDSVAISDPIKMFSKYPCSSNCFFALITCFDSWFQFSLFCST